MYVNITGSSNNKDVYIYQSFRKENGKTSSHIYKKLGSFLYVHFVSLHVLEEYPIYLHVFLTTK